MTTAHQAQHSAQRSDPMPQVPPWEDEEPYVFNVGSYLSARAVERPFQRALIVPERYNALGTRMYSHLTFMQLNTLCDAYAHGLAKVGFERGDRVVMMVSQGFELIALTYALFKMGVVPVMIDPGMGRQGFLTCVKHTQPDGFIGIPLAHALREVFRKAFVDVKHEVITKKKWWSRAHALPKIADYSKGPYPLAQTMRDDLAAILFTSGSTGLAKGVHYTHGIFDGQVKAIGAMYDIEPGEIEVPAFPLFSLFSVALGMSVVIPDMNPTKPATVDPKNMIEPILDHGATSAYGSPVVWTRVAAYCKKHDIVLPTLRRVLTAGAPINPVLLQSFQNILPQGAMMHTPYGATECLPVASASSHDVLSRMHKTAVGKGLCVGKPVVRMNVRIIEVKDEAIESWSKVKELGTGCIGEICVSGPTTTRQYDRREEATRRAKIFDPERGTHAFWHRMGDVGYFDDEGMLWYCGRKNHRVETAQGVMFSVSCEGVFNTHEDVFRSALVGIGARGAQHPVIVIEAKEGKHPAGITEQKEFAARMLKLAATYEVTCAIKNVLFHRSLPVDRRHNAKIHREEVAQWAAEQLGALVQHAQVVASRVETSKT